MRRLALAVVAAVALSFAVASTSRAGDLSPDEQKWVKDLVTALGGNSPRVRKGAEEALTKMGVDALPTIAEVLPNVKGEAATKGLKRALDGMGRADVLAACGRLAASAPTRAAAKRFEDVAALLGGGAGGAAGGEVPNSIALVAAHLEDQSLAPLTLERAIEKRIPPSLAPGTFVADEVAGVLRVDADGDGKQETTVAQGPGRVVEFGPADHRVALLLYAKGGRWWACPASLVRGGAGSNAVECLDGDLDGEFGGPGDFVRAADGAFTPVGMSAVDRRLLVEDGVVTWKVVKEGAAWRMALVPEAPPPGLDDLAAEGILAVNRWRRAIGLPPVRLDAARCDGCKKHALYLQRNDGSPDVAGLGAHHETEGKPGYTSEGSMAADHTVLSSINDPTRAVASLLSTMLHGAHLVGPGGHGFGIGVVGGKGGGTVLWGSEPDPSAGDGAPLVVPAPGQRRVPLRGGREEPPPDQPTGWYDAPRGFPVSVFHGRAGIRHPDVRLFLADGKTPVAGHMWTEEAPIAAGHSYGQGIAFFMPAAPLEPKQGYVAVVSGAASSGPVSWTWSFRTD